MPYLYECRQCGGRSPERHDRRDDAEDEQTQHRAAAHGGLAPAAGDGVRAVHDEARGDGCLPSGSFLFVLFLIAALVSNCWGR
jgi:predicted  nucleic acid-binding Zn-ribbon protein